MEAQNRPFGTCEAPASPAILPTPTAAKALPATAFTAVRRPIPDASDLVKSSKRELLIGAYPIPHHVPSGGRVPDRRPQELFVRYGHHPLPFPLRRSTKRATGPATGCDAAPGEIVAISNGTTPKVRFDPSPRGVRVRSSLRSDLT